MRSISFVAFGATLAVLVPAAVDHLTAGPREVARMYAAPSNTALIGGVEVKAELDRGVFEAGQNARLRLTAAKPLTVGVVVLATRGDPNGRVPEPPIGVTYREVRIVPDAQGKPTEVALALRGATVGYKPLEEYTVYVLSTAAATRLHQVADITKPLIDTGAIPDMPSGNLPYHRVMSRIEPGNTFSESEIERKRNDTLFAAGTVARLEARVRRRNPAFELSVPESPTSDTFSIAVTLTNRSKRRVKEASLDISLAYGDNGDDKANVVSKPDKIDLGPWESRRVEVQVRSERKGLLGIHARLSCYRPCVAPRELTDGAYDAVETP